MLATPQLADDSSLAVRQLDLALVLLLATLAGIGAPSRGRSARRAPSRAPWPTSAAPRWRWAADSRCRRGGESTARVRARVRGIRADGRRYRLEPARAGGGATRTAAVLATVATGVVGLDPEGRVLIANLQAVELLGMKLEEGDRLLDRLGPEWRPRLPPRWLPRRPHRRPDGGARGRRPPALPSALLARARRARRGDRPERRDRRVARGARAGVGGDGPAGGSRDQEPPHPDAPRAAASSPGLPGTARGVRSDAGGHRGADAGGDRPAGHDCPGLQPLCRAGG